MSGAPSWVDHPDLVAYYASHRNRPDELYPSERRFLPGLAREAESVLDVGCGAGGFASVWRAFNPSLRYTGVDVSAALVRAARDAHPEHEFIQADAAHGLPLPDQGFDVVAALGWLHWEPRYRDALAELWRVTEQHLFFDLRMLDGEGPPLHGQQRLALGGEWDGHSSVPYICARWPQVAAELLDLGPGRLTVHGYWGDPADTVMGVQGQICFATFVLERDGTGRPRPQLSLELPLAWPPALSDRVEVAA